MVRSMHPRTNLHISTTVVFTSGRSVAPSHDMAGKLLESDENYGVSVPRINSPGTVANIQGAALEAGSIVIDNCLSRLFVAAYLLTGSVKQAEWAISESIRQLDIHATRSGCLPWKTIAAAIVRGDPGSEQAPDEASSVLPVELLRVLRLSPRLRQCFVLRFLMAMPRQYCADLLRIDAEEVDANSCLAARELAGIAA